MSKFWVKVRVKQEKNAEHLIRAFFQDFNPESSIVVRGEEAKLEIVFRKPPMAIIDAINHCEVIEMNYGKNLKEYKEDENLQDETVNDSEQVKAESESSEQAEQPKKKRGRQTTKKKESTKDSKSKQKSINIPELEEIAKKSSSFEEFAKLVTEWLEMGKRQEFFENLAIVSTEVDKISWKELEGALENKGVTYKQSEKVLASNQVSKKLKEQSITILPLLNAIRQYKEYSFKNLEEHSYEENSTESVIPKKRLKMECMPEIKEFEETLASVDKTQPVEERVLYVLKAMGLNKMPVEEQKQIVEIASTAVRKGEMTFDTIFGETNIPDEETMTARMTLSKFINDFVKKYESSKKVKSLTFLSELQKIIMFDSEIENISKFSD